MRPEVVRVSARRRGSAAGPAQGRGRVQRQRISSHLLSVRLRAAGPNRTEVVTAVSIGKRRWEVVSSEIISIVENFSLGFTNTVYRDFMGSAIEYTSM